MTQTDKRSTREHKTQFIQQVREQVDQYDSLYVLSFENMRSHKFKDVRMQFKDSRIFMGKNKLLQLALGRTPEDEYADNLRHASKQIAGSNVALLLTSEPRQKVEEYFNQLEEADFARAGSTASREVVVSNIAQFPVSMMEQLRQLGLPVEIENGKIVWRDGRTEHRICKEGEVLSAEKCKLLKHFDLKLADFAVSLVCRWANGEFEEY